MTVSQQAQYGPQRERAATAAPVKSAYTGTGRPVDLERPYRGENYYGEPPIKASHYGWLITAYFFIGGLASAAQFLATIADLMGGRRDRSVVRAGRYIALIGALVSPVLLIADLHTPRRWFNMLRIYRGTSAMSIGSWALSIFGAFSGLVALGQLVEDFGLGVGGVLARLAQLPAAAAGGIVALYTGTLMAATNMPLVSAAFPFLSSLFASSAASTAVAALALVAEATDAPRSTKRSLNLVALVAGASELVFSLLVQRLWQEHDTMEALNDGPIGLGFRAGVLGLGIGAPLAVHTVEAISGRRSGVATVLAGISALIGGFILRAVFVFGGNESARRPEDYFRLTEADGAGTWGGNDHGAR
jgi:protein NrfD